jgi:hypothetical protein
MYPCLSYVALSACTHVPLPCMYLCLLCTLFLVPLLCMYLCHFPPLVRWALTRPARSCLVFVMRLVRMYLHRLFTGRRLPSFRVKAMPTPVFLCLVYFPFLFPLSNQSVLKEPSSPVLFALHLATYFTNLTWFSPNLIIHFKSSSLALERPFHSAWPCTTRHYT